MSEFDAKASTWDDPAKVERARAVAARIRAAVPLAHSMRTLEYGAGTGLLSFALRDAVGPITLADSSEGMRAVAAEKIAAAGAADMRVLDLDLLRDPVPDERYDLVVSLLTMHHVPDVPRVLGAFAALLAPGGWVCIADLDSEDGSFHGPDAHVHHGFDRPGFAAALTAAGFEAVAVGDACDMVHGGRRYTVFLACGRRPAAR